MSDPRKRDPGTSDDEFAKFREKQLARRKTQAQRKPGSGPITAQERARQEIQRLEEARSTKSRATSRQALERAREEMRNKETGQAQPRPSRKLSRETMMRGRAEVHENERAGGSIARRPTGKISREAMERAKRERQALDHAEAVRMGQRPPRLDPPSDPAVRPDMASDAEFEKFRRLQLRRKRLEAMGLDKNPDIKPDESAGAFFGTTPVERQAIRGATQSFRAEEIEDLGEHQDAVVSDLREVEGTMDEIPEPKPPRPAPDDWLDKMD